MSETPENETGETGETTVDERPASLNLFTRGGVVITVPGITVDKAEDYAAACSHRFPGTLENRPAEELETPLVLIGNEGNVRTQVQPAEVIGTQVVIQVPTPIEYA